MSDVKAVVVRFPLSGEDCMTIRKHITSKCLTNDGIVNGIRAIGTPVAGGELEVVGYVPGEDIPLYGDEGIDDTCFTEMSLHRQADNDIPLVRQSDHQAALAAAQAEIVRDSERLDWLGQKFRSCTVYMNGEQMFIPGPEVRNLKGHDFREAIDKAREVE